MAVIAPSAVRIRNRWVKPAMSPVDAEVSAHTTIKIVSKAKPITASNTGGLDRFPSSII